MTQKPHSATVSMAGETLVAKLGAATIASSDRAMILEEVNGEKAYPPVVYFPLDDIDADALEATDHRTHCPIKGDASYYTVKGDGQRLENAAWTYRDPLPLVGAVKNYVAFYPGKVSVERA
ncbi:DUF427 domain-containing protein [Pelagibius sp. CAU 1746]|uniref:DUF427 domain-containing protein n=1 Tax=Pelagibius sp. CAU 1746 TaxID=3140370 RepID=UPI00325B0A60